MRREDQEARVSGLGPYFRVAGIIGLTKPSEEG